MCPMTDVKAVLLEDAAIAEAALDKYLSEEYIGGGKLAEAMRYAVLGGGKRIRAALTLEFCKLFGAERERALPFACAVEMIHAYSLVHDDMPCMDDDDMRRGKPSCHAAFGEATALLTGDTLLTYAFAVTGGAAVSPLGIISAVKCLAYFAGALGMTGGQMMDEENVCDTYDKLMRLHSLKTSALIKAAALSGYFATVTDMIENSIVNDVTEFSECLGLAFQIKDDLLDLEGDAAVIGKRVGVDTKNGRYTSLSFMTPDEARAECQRLADKASKIVSKYDGSEFLSALPYYLNSRNK